MLIKVQPKDFVVTNFDKLFLYRLTLSFMVSKIFIEHKLFVKF